MTAHVDTIAALRELAAGNKVSGTETLRVAIGIMRMVEAEVRNGNLLAVVERDFRGQWLAVQELELTYLKPIREMTSAERAAERDANPDGYFKRLSAENCKAAIADVRERDRRRATETRRHWFRRLTFGRLGGDR
ncbi:hypothetical protein [Kribbella deserti]|uniref:Uncharacterized protein n=1 Tax=Kribbella deserti TaxID=1926257 RepID=A0ABV6QUD3_9ACTN